jgi:hypothetical protein
MLWAMLGTMLAAWAVFAVPFGLVMVLKRRRQARRRGWTGGGGKTPGAFSRLNAPAKPPPGTNPKTGSPF